ncbi:MAG: GWxTD domain-containing protein [Candidatus Aminicenantes bacterium]|nr:GWxTD domain-containing protein [Candidatus Aminicenantes bacterium]
MKTRTLVVAFSLLLVASALAGPEKLSPELRTWLEDVSPILTRTERAVFQKLQTNTDREKFVRFFWRMRDPLPDTTANEFQKEYEERVRFADQNFGRSSPKRGSQTDRGFFYLVLGPPLERNFFTTESQVWPNELWFYKGAVEYGLPDYFYLIFYQPEGIGDYRLYSPGVDGPEKLAVPIGGGGSMNRSQAVEAIRKASSELASAALSYLPGDRPMGSSSFSSDTIIASVRGLPEKKFSDSYARSYMSYKDYIETEYSDNYLQSAFQVKVFRESGQAFVHWTIEPEKMNFGVQGSAIYASFELVLRLEDSRGGLIFEKVEEIPIRLTPEQYKAHERQRFAFQDVLALVPGEHRALFLLKNKTGKDFSSFETRVAAQADPGAGQAGLSVPLIFHDREAVPEAQKNNLKAFVFGGWQYIVGARNEFSTASTLGVFVQAWNLDKLGLSGQPSFILDIISLDTNQSVGAFPLKDVAADPGDPATLLVSGTVPLKDVKPGYYRAEISARSADGRMLLAQKENFVVLSQAVPVIPWVYARLHGPFPGPEHLKVLGSQYFLSGDYEHARVTAEKVLRQKDDPDSRLLLAKSLYGLGRFKESLGSALPLYERAPDREAAKVIALDYAALKDWNSALTYLDKLMAEATEVPVLNLAAECLLALDRPDEALLLLQKSLSLVPDQPAIKALEEKTRKRAGQI